MLKQIFRKMIELRHGKQPQKISLRAVQCRHRKLNPDKHHTAMDELLDLLMEPQLPPVTRLNANVALADGTPDWFLAEHRRNAERTYHFIRSEIPVDDTRWPS